MENDRHDKRIFEITSYFFYNNRNIELPWLVWTADNSPSDLS